ncbi:MAG: serine/threonine-protein kinase, partial [Chloroflexota bacterium]
MSKYLGKTIRAYTLNQEIGSGGFGTVFKAKHKVLGRDVAAKVIKDKFVNEPQFVRQFESEARIIAGLEHANIVPLYDFFRDPSGALLVMRWLSGGSLRQQLKKGRMTIPQIVQTFNQIVKALAFAHRHNVIHRDIKPENILLDEERNAFLTDFGIAVDMRNQDEQNIENISFGSPDYVAPEQLGKNKTLTHHSDIYSLG